MAAPISKEEYLKRYLSGEDNAKKSKKRKKNITEANKKQKLTNSIRIFDDDVDIWRTKENQSKVEKPTSPLKESSDDEAPAIAEIVDDRPWEVKRKEFYGSEKWRNFGDEKSDIHKEVTPEEKTLHDSDSDHSFVKKNHRKNRHDSGSDVSPPRKIRHDSDSDSSPLRNTRHDSDSDISPRKSRHDSGSDISPPRKHQNSSDSDISPPRHHKKSTNSDISPPRHHKRSSDSDISPPRHHKKSSDSDISPPRRHKKSSDSDISPPRRYKKSSDSDVSPPRKAARNSNYDVAPSDGKDTANSSNKRKKTLAGTKAGLQDAKSMKEEVSAIRKREAELSKMNADDMGKDALPQLRKSAKLKLQQENMEKQEKEKKEAIIKEKYSRWGKGLKQSEMQENKLQADLHEMSKPLSRYEGDNDLERHLKEKEDIEDPMFEYMRKKKQKKNKENSTKGSFPMYNGPAPPPARFNIRPGYRWDGIDRSNGFENKIILKKASKQARKEEAYKWSVEDM